MKSKENLLGAYVMIAGVLIALILGLFQVTFIGARQDPELLSQYWDEVYKVHVKEAKKYANQGRLDVGFNVAQYDM